MLLTDGVSSVGRIGDINVNGGSESAAVYGLIKEFITFWDDMKTPIHIRIGTITVSCLISEVFFSWDDKEGSEMCGGCGGGVSEFACHICKLGRHELAAVLALRV
jgi:hypothetical protein